MKKIILFLLTSLNLVNSALVALKSYPCPFNDECTCSEYESKPGISVYCKQGFNETGFDYIPNGGPTGLPKFDISSEKKYEINQMNIVSTDVNKLPANYFSVFKSIGFLVLFRPIGVAPFQWDENCFDGTRIDAVHIVNVSGLLPAPSALSKLGRRGLKSFSIWVVDDPISLNRTVLDDFPDLTDFEIYRSPIRFLDEDPFGGIKKNLEYLVLTGSIGNSALAKFPITHLRNLKNLKSLFLAGYEMDSVPSGYFVQFPKLQELYIKDTDLLKSIDNGVFDILPSNLTYLNVSDSNVTIVPTRMLESPCNITTMILEKNRISEIRRGDFRNVPKLEKVIISENPISSIEYGAFSNLKSLRSFDLEKSDLKSLDLSVFNGMASNVSLYLPGNMKLEYFYISNMDGFPDHAYIDLRASAIEKIDPTIKTFLDSFPNVRIDFTSGNLKCSNLGWLAEYVLCSRNVRVDGTTCIDRNGQSLRGFLKNDQQEPVTCGDEDQLKNKEKKGEKTPKDSDSILSRAKMTRD